MIRGTRPQAAPMPAEAGYYWIKIATPRYVTTDYDRGLPDAGYCTWDDFELSWVIAHVDPRHGQNVEVFGSDDFEPWERHNRVTIDVVARIQDPR